MDHVMSSCMVDQQKQEGLICFMMLKFSRVKQVKINLQCWHRHTLTCHRHTLTCFYTTVACKQPLWYAILHLYLLNQLHLRVHSLQYWHITEEITIEDLLYKYTSMQNQHPSHEDEVQHFQQHVQDRTQLDIPEGNHLV